jgi:Protein of unknown function (DUF2939)
MTNSRKVLVLVVALGVGLTSLILSPWWSLAGMVQAVATGDRYRIEQYVDFPRVREGLASQLKAQMAAEVGKDDDSPFAAMMGATIGSVMVDRLVDTYVSPAGLVQFLRARAVPLDHVKSRPEIVFGMYRQTRLEWLSLSAVRVDWFTEDGRVSALLARSGLHWTVVSLDLPFPAVSTATHTAAAE